MNSVNKMHNTQRFSKRDVLALLFKNKYSNLIIFVTAMLVSFFYCTFTTPMYRAESELLIQIGREKFSGMNAMSTANDTVIFEERIQNINNELEILRGQPLFLQFLPKAKQLYGDLYENRDSGDLSPVDGIRRNLSIWMESFFRLMKKPFVSAGLLKEASSDEKLEILLSRAVEVEQMEETDIIKLFFSWDDPVFAKEALNLFIDEYLKYHTKVHQVENTFNLYVQQLDLNRRGLEDIQKQIKELYDRKSISNIEIQKELLLSEISNLEKKHREAVIETGNIDVKINEINQMLLSERQWVETPNVGQLGENLTDLTKLDQLYFDLKSEKETMLINFLETSREVRDIERQMAELKRQKGESLINLLKIEKIALQSQEKILSENLLKKQDRLSELIPAKIKLDQMELEKRITEEKYLLYNSKVEELRVFNELDKNQILSVKIINPATVPVMPYHPRTLLIMIVSAFLSLVAGLGYSVVREYFNQGLKDFSDFDQLLNLRLLTTVRENRVLGMDWARSFVDPNSGTWKGNANPSNVYDFPFDIQHNYEELYKVLKEKGPGNDNGLRTLGIVSSKKGEGTSTIAILAAFALSTDPSCKTLLIDSNLKNGSNGQGQGKTDPGFTDLVQGRAGIGDIVKKVDKQNIYYMPAGNPVDSSVAFFQSESFSRVLPLLKQSFHHVIFDAPPVLSTPEVSILASRFDGVLLNVCSEKTNKNAVILAKHYLDKVDARIIGGVLNRKKHHIPDMIYNRL